MSDNLVPYERYSDFSTRLHFTGKCKKKTITYNYSSPVEIIYLQCRVKVFGIPLWTRWVDKDYIVWRSEKEEVYDCDCTGKKVHDE